MARQECHIDPIKNLTIITNRIDIVYECRNKPNLRVIVLGGIIDYSNNCIVGPTVPNMLKEFNPSKVGLLPLEGISCDPEGSASGGFCMLFSPLSPSE